MLLIQSALLTPITLSTSESASSLSVVSSSAGRSRPGPTAARRRGATADGRDGSDSDPDAVVIEPRFEDFDDDDAASLLAAAAAGAALAADGEGGGAGEMEDDSQLGCRCCSALGDAGVRAPSQALSASDSATFAALLKAETFVCCGLVSAWLNSVATGTCDWPAVGVSGSSAVAAPAEASDTGGTAVPPPELHCPAAATVVVGVGEDCMATLLLLPKPAGLSRCSSRPPSDLSPVFCKRSGDSCERLGTCKRWFRCLGV